jgi:polyhydroxybutyrate depolymerase
VGIPETREGRRVAVRIPTAHREARFGVLFRHLPPPEPRPSSMNTMVRLLLASASALAAALVASGGGALTAQSVDLGRGPVDVTVPAGYDAAVPAPLIVQLHGYGGSGAGQLRYMGIGELADAYGFITVAPDGSREEEGRQAPFWNASSACCNFRGSEIDDVGYLKSLIDEIGSRWNVDPNRIYFVGHSNGGFMSYRMAYEHPETVAAIASLAGATERGQRPPPAAPVHVLQIHGTDDTVIEYAGGGFGPEDSAYPSARTSVGQWAGFSGCDARGQAREMRDLDASLPGHETGVMVFEAGCMPGGSATLWTISDGGHSPMLSDTYAEQVVEWLLAHPKR